MSIPAPNHAPHSRLATWRPGRRDAIALGGAFLLGLALFLVATSGQRDAPAVAPTSVANGVEFDPLPTPMPADAAGASGLEQPDDAATPDEQPRLVEAPRPVLPPAPSAAIRSDAPPANLARVDAVPISSPAPTYPRRAMQRRQTGTVRVQVQVGVDGRPQDVRVVESSESRDLDRAALDAVRRWRFRPAQQDGQPVSATVVVPIAFRL